MSTILPDDLKEEGIHLFERGQHQQALAKFEEAAHVYARQGDHAGQAEMLNNVGVVSRVLGKRDAALAALNQAAALFSQVGDHNRQAQALGNLGDLYAGGRNKDEAARCYSDAAALFAQADDPLKQSQVLRALSLMRLRQGQWLEAMMRMEESLLVRPRISLLQRLFRGLLRFALNLLGISRP